MNTKNKIRRVIAVIARNPERVQGETSSSPINPSIHFSYPTRYCSPREISSAIIMIRFYITSPFSTVDDLPSTSRNAAAFFDLGVGTARFTTSIAIEAHHDDQIFNPSGYRFHSRLEICPIRSRRSKNNISRTQYRPASSVDTSPVNRCSSRQHGIIPATTARRILRRRRSWVRIATIQI